MSEEVLQVLSKKIKSTLAHLEEELRAIRASRANPQLVEGVLVEAYEGRLPLKQLATITAPAADTLIVQPWDEGVLAAVEKALRTSEAARGTVSVEGTLIRVKLSPLSSERREELARLVKRKGEEAQIALRNIRHEALEGLTREDLPEDDVFRGKKRIQEEIAAAAEQVKGMVDSKVEDITSL